MLTPAWYSPKSTTHTTQQIAVCVCLNHRHFPSSPTLTHIHVLFQVNVEQATVQVVSSTMTALPASEGHDATLWKRDARIVDIAARTGASIFTATPQDAPMNATIGYIAARPRTGYDGTRRFHLSLRCLQRGVVRVAASVMIGKKVVETVHIEGACEQSDYVLMRRGTMFQVTLPTGAAFIRVGGNA